MKVTKRLFPATEFIFIRISKNFAFQPNYNTPNNVRSVRNSGHHGMVRQSLAFCRVPFPTAQMLTAYVIASPRLSKLSAERDTVFPQSEPKINTKNIRKLIKRTNHNVFFLCSRIGLNLTFRIATPSHIAKILSF